MDILVIQQEVDFLVGNCRVFDHVAVGLEVDFIRKDGFPPLVGDFFFEVCDSSVAFHTCTQGGVSKWDGQVRVM